MSDFGDLDGPHVHHDRGDVTGDGISLAAQQHRLAQLGRDIDPLDRALVDLVDVREQRKKLPACIADRSCNRFSIEVLRRLDRAGRLGLDRERGLVVHHHHRKQLMIGIGAIETNHRVEVCQTDVVGAARDLGNGIAGTEAAVDGDVELVFLECAVIGRNRERRLLSLKCPVENEPDFLILGVARRDENRCRQDACRPSRKSPSARAHECHLLLDADQLRFKVDPKAAADQRSRLDQPACSLAGQDRPEHRRSTNPFFNLRIILLLASCCAGSCAADRIIRAFSGKVDTGFPQKMRPAKEAGARFRSNLIETRSSALRARIVARFAMIV